MKKKLIIILMTTISLGLNAQNWTAGTGGSIYYSGNVGIGTSTPQFKLEVAGPGHFTGRLSQSGAVANDNNAAFSNTDATGYGFYSLGGAGTHYAFHFLNQAGQTLFYGKGDGNVGIGTNNPQYKLDVNGSGNFTGRISQTAALANDNNVAFTNSDAAGYGLFSQGGAGTHYVFHFLNQPGESVLFGKGNGNVGIGTTDPDKKLTVKGTIHAQEVVVDLNFSSGPDYVFEPAYNLQPLSEVELYIKQNKHLPEVPSAKQMEEEGLNLKEMNLILLKKVEELTLHLIDQQKTNMDQNKVIEEQQKEIEILKSKIK